MTDTMSDAIASELETGIAEAHERQRVEQRLAQADDMERELSLYRAGIPLHQKVGGMFLATYDGPLDDPDAIQAAWFEATDQPVPADVARRIEARRIAAELRTTQEKT